ncbi:hypothetical protein RchiOBHm_Chr1g0348621 [Rosa chinensis]|uniref:Uncharacterized protein n=1 Tax=Rosa chinensis TaxID=74649 RepID=A0A2P6SFL8_ROSCH|nr:hypothetical protein RchiOBHm_Chr1g0348621 [Rosa chinensis]
MGGWLGVQVSSPKGQNAAILFPCSTQSLLQSSVLNLFPSLVSLSLSLSSSVANQIGCFSLFALFVALFFSLRVQLL